MPVFKSSDQLKEVLGGFFKKLTDDPKIGPQLLESKLVLKFVYHQPEAIIIVDLSGSKAVITYDDDKQKGHIQINMKGDTAHHFWLGDLNIIIAMAKRDITTKGPISKLLQLLPIIKPAYQLYKEYTAPSSLNTEK